MKYKILLLCVCVSSLSFAQENDLTSIGKFTVGISSLSIDYQFPISNSWVLDSKIGIGAGADLNDGSISIDYAKPSLFFETGARYLYNFSKRKELRRTTKYNSASFIGIKTSYHLDSFNNDMNEEFGNTLSFSGVWGMQRSLDSNILFNLHVGLGWANDFNRNYSSLYPELGIGFSYVIF